MPLGRYHVLIRSQYCFQHKALEIFVGCETSRKSVGSINLGWVTYVLTVLVLCSSGNMAWSSNKRALLVSNLAEGVDVYVLSEQLTFSRRLVARPVRYNAPIQVDFAQNDELIVSGSDRGEVYLWEWATGNLVQVLRHGGTFFFIQHNEDFTHRMYRYILCPSHISA